MKITFGPVVIQITSKKEKNPVEAKKNNPTSTIEKVEPRYTSPYTIKKKTLLTVDRASPEKGSWFANWEIASSLPRSNGKEVPLNTLPYKSRLE